MMRLDTRFGSLGLAFAAGLGYPARENCFENG
jgi:hypothetical protein